MNIHNILYEKYSYYLREFCASANFYVLQATKGTLRGAIDVKRFLYEDY